VSSIWKRTQKPVLSEIICAISEETIFDISLKFCRFTEESNRISTIGALEVG
jgi:hypothetical protein